MPPAFPVSSVDPFADDFLAEPYPFYEDLREAGPVVWLEHYGLWTCARHAEVHAVLSDWETYFDVTPPAPPAMSPSGPGFICASARCWHGSRSR
jgi:cytochrome P450